MCNILEVLLFKEIVNGSKVHFQCRKKKLLVAVAFHVKRVFHEIKLCNVQWKM